MMDIIKRMDKLKRRCNKLKKRQFNTITDIMFDTNFKRETKTELKGLLQ